MKKVTVLLLALLAVGALTACRGMRVSQQTYREIADYVLQNIDALCPEEEIAFFRYESTGLLTGGVDYGYYYTQNDEIAVPDFYWDGDLGEQRGADGGVYFGKPNSGTDWCYVKQITEHWYYYELHTG